LDLHQPAGNGISVAGSDERSVDAGSRE
jgi:hypothetical protein